jgi:hypothetical protein
MNDVSLYPRAGALVIADTCILRLECANGFSARWAFAGCEEERCSWWRPNDELVRLESGPDGIRMVWSDESPSAHFDMFWRHIKASLRGDTLPDREREALLRPEEERYVPMLDQQAENAPSL